MKTNNSVARHLRSNNIGHKDVDRRSHQTVFNRVRRCWHSILPCKKQEQVLASVEQDIRTPQHENPRNARNNQQVEVSKMDARSAGEGEHLVVQLPNAFGSVQQLPQVLERKVLSFLDVASLGVFSSTSKEGYVATSRFLSTVNAQTRLDAAIHQLFGDSALAVRKLPELHDRGMNPGSLKKQVTKLLKAASQPSVIGAHCHKPNDFFAAPVQDFVAVRNYLYSVVTLLSELDRSFVRRKPHETIEKLSLIQVNLRKLESCAANLPFLQISDKLWALRRTAGAVGRQAFEQYCRDYDEYVRASYDYLAGDLLLELRKLSYILNSPGVTSAFFERVERASQLKQMNSHLSRANAISQEAFDDDKLKAYKTETKRALELARTLNEDISDKIAGMDFDIHMKQYTGLRRTLSQVDVDV